MTAHPAHRPDVRPPLAGPLLATLWLLYGCAPSPLPEPEVSLGQLSALTYGPAVEHYDERAAVKASVSAARLDEHWVVVRGVFTPEEAGYHLYSKDLPKEGIQETGRPTLIEIANGASQSGVLLADQSPHDFTQYGVTIPVYPEGPVTLYRLARPKGGATSLSAALTYMSCSTELCNLPVEGEIVEVPLP